MKRTLLLVTLLSVLIASKLSAQYCTSPSWYSESSLSSGYGMNSFNITGYSGSSLSDAGITAAADPTTGFLSRTSLGAVTLQQGGAYSGTISYGTFATYMESQIWIDFNDDSIFDASEVVVSPVVGFSSSFSTISTPFTLNVPLTAITGTHLMRVRCAWMEISSYTGTVSAPMDPCTTCDPYLCYWSGDVVDYLVTIVALPPCTGTPLAGTVTAPDSVCGTTSFNLGLAGSTSAIGLTYQWEASPDSTVWTVIVGATTIPYSTTETANTYYRCIVGCGSLYDTSAGFLEIHSPICYCTTPAWYSEGSLSSGYGMDQLSLAGYSGATLSDAGIIAAADPSSGYLNRTGLGASFALQQAGTYSGTVTYGTSSDYMETQIWIDFNDDGIFDPSEVVVSPVAGFSSSTYSFSTPITLNIPLTATTGVHRMRVRCIWMEISTYTGSVSSPMDPCAECDASVCYYSGDVVDYLVTIIALPPCSGVPVAGTVTAPPSSCGSTAFTLNLSGSTAATGLTYQWESSPDSTVWTVIAGATTIPYSTTEAANTYYRCIVGCGSLYDTSAGLLEIHDPVCYCTTPAWYSEGSLSSGYGMDQLSLAGYSGATLSDAGIIAAANPSDGYLDRTGLGASFALQQGGSYSGTVTYGTSSDYMETQIWIDFNDDGIFDPSEVIVSPVAGFSSSTYSFSTPITLNIPLTATLGVHRMRVRCIWMEISTYFGSVSSPMDPCTECDASVCYYSGDVVDYIVTIDTLPPCSGIPTAGTVSAPSTVCGSTSFALGLTGATFATGITYQWQSSPDSIAWINIAGATTAPYTTTEATATYYRCIVTCSGSGSYDSTAGVLVLYRTLCPCIPSYYDYTFYGTPAPTDGIANFSMTGYSGTVINDNGPASPPANGYEDETSISITLEQGGSYPGTVTYSPADDYYENQIWIDFNDDAIFEPGEQVTMMYPILRRGKIES